MRIDERTLLAHLSQGIGHARLGDIIGLHTFGMIGADTEVHGGQTNETNNEDGHQQCRVQGHHENHTGLLSFLLQNVESQPSLPSRAFRPADQPASSPYHWNPRMDQCVGETVHYRRPPNCHYR